jgi:hypothetical protein
MPVETPSVFAHVIQEHLELKRKNSELEPEMPLQRYESQDPFENHPLFKTEEQARIEETMDGEESIPAEQLPSLVAAPEQPHDDDTLWGRSRDFDWGD